MIAHLSAKACNFYRLTLGFRGQLRTAEIKRCRTHDLSIMGMHLAREQRSDLTGKEVINHQNE